MEHELENIARWIVKSMQGKLTPGEERQLKEWREASRENREMHDRIVRGNEVGARYSLWNSLDEQRALDNVLHRVRRKRTWRLLPHAAAILAAACVALWMIDGQEPATDARPAGTREVELVLGNGERIGLAGNKTDRWQLDNAELLLQDSVLSYRATGEAAAGDNTLVIPRGATFIVSLSDGTRVHLNASSSITYPVTFAATERRVILTGQAYFEVQPESNRPFVVETAYHAVSVLGTAFDVRAYPDEERMETTLCSGSVAVSFPGGDRYTLRPGEQLLFRAREAKVEIKEVNTSIATAWMDDNFYFYNNTLEEIFTELQRWFPVEVVFVNDSKRDRTFSGKFSRFKDMETILNVMRKAGVEIEQEGEIIRIE
ncbi:MAG: FecR domain-containing protein [Odoribacteraceae bacterium]|jgi:ferric-dicitrate binding protein FerR (iron transport regulator)|nr:FecR domain-containing protein [Odoribacteraceae bacterium]